jgi:hypothetical protein
MKTLRLTVTDFWPAADGYMEYIGEVNLETRFDGNVEIDGGLGPVRFNTSLNVKGRLRVYSGTSIRVEGIVEAGGYIEAEGEVAACRGIFGGQDLENPLAPAPT